MTPTRAKYAFFGMLAAVTLAIAFVMRGDFFHFLFTLLVVVVVFPVTGGPWLHYRWLAERATTPEVRATRSNNAALFKRLFQCALCVPSSCYAGHVITRCEAQAAKTWCEDRVADIESFRVLNDRFPSSFEEFLNNDDEPPNVNRWATQFWSSKNDYGFDVQCNDNLAGNGWTWSKSMPTWRYYN